MRLARRHSGFQYDLWRGCAALVDVAKGDCAIGKRTRFDPVEITQGAAIEELDSRAQVDHAVGVVTQKGNFIEGQATRIEAGFIIQQTDV